MTEKITMVTTTRDDLFDISQTLFGAMQADLFSDPLSPLVVAVRGTIRSGKRIITDAARAELFGTTSPVLRGREGFDEFWTGKLGNHDFELDYIDIARDRGFYTDGLNNPDAGLQKSVFLAERRNGGVSFIQNLSLPEDDSGKNELGTMPGIEFWIEKYNSIMFFQLAKRSGCSPLSKAFRNAAQHSDSKKWARYVEVTITDPRLLESQGFQSAVNTLSASAREVGEILKKARFRKPKLPKNPYRMKIL